MRRIITMHFLDYTVWLVDMMFRKRVTHVLQIA